MPKHIFVKDRWQMKKVVSHPQFETGQIENLYIPSNTLSTDSKSKQLLYCGYTENSILILIYLKGDLVLNS